MVSSTKLFGELADHDMEQRVKASLTQRHVPALRALQVQARGGVITLRGPVSSAHERYLGQSIARRVAGVLGLVDLIEVQSAPRGPRSEMHQLTLSPALRRTRTQSITIKFSHALDQYLEARRNARKEQKGVSHDR